MTTWFDDAEPFEPDVSRAQIDGLVAIFGNGPKRILDLGCGAGRVLVPLAAAGHDLTGIDSNPAMIAACSKAIKEAGLSAALHVCDFLEYGWESAADDPEAQGKFDAAICLGNTFMQIALLGEARRLLRNVAASLSPEGALIMDDLPGMYWPELTEGNWQSGMSPLGEMQLIWDPRDAVFIVREGADVDPSDWTIRATDRRFRLWTHGALTLAAELSGLSEPEPVGDAGLLVLRRA